MRTETTPADNELHVTPTVEETDAIPLRLGAMDENSAMKA
jgi:hypothetical protein